MCWLLQSAQLWCYPTFLLPPLLAIAWIECMAGYRAWRFLLGVNGAVLGFVGGVMAGAWTGVPVMMAVGGLAGGVLGTMVFTGIEALGGLVFSLGTGVSLVLVSATATGFPERWRLAVAIVAGVASAAGVLARGRAVMIGLTSVAGAQQVAVAWHAYHMPATVMPMADVVDAREWLMFAVLAAAGVMVQVCTTRPRGRGRREITRGLVAVGK